MSEEKKELARAGTIEITSKVFLEQERKTEELERQEKYGFTAVLTLAETTSKRLLEGKAFLEKNLTEWKKPMLMQQFDEEDKTEASASSDDKATGGKKRGKGAKGGPKGKKPKMSKAGTMAVTAKEGAELLGGEELGDTRQVTKAKPKSSPAPKRTSTMNKTLEEAKAVVGTVNSSEGRKLRKRPAPPAAPKKTPVKKAGTMVKTAKEGKAFLKKGRPKSAKASS